MRYGGTTVATHTLVTDDRRELWDPEHRRRVEHAALDRHLHVVPDPEPAPEPAPAGAAGGERLELGEGDHDIEVVDLVGRVGPICECAGGVSS